MTKAATSAPFEGRPMYAALRATPIPDDVVERLFHAASLLREHRGDGHIAALMVEGVGGLEAHVPFALDMGMPAEKFGRIHHSRLSRGISPTDFCPWGDRAENEGVFHAAVTQQNGIMPSGTWFATSSPRA